jgi:16S rRNA (guanine527-N7)-methyltransferase
VIERWLAELETTPGLTSLSGDEARRVHLDESLAALDVVRGFEGPIVDVGSGGGAPGIPLAWALAEREVTLLEATRRKCDFLERWTEELPNARVLCGRAEEQPADGCLPLVSPGGAAVLYVGPTAQTEQVARVAAQLAAELEESPAGLLVLRKLGPTPEGFPRRAGVARKRPLA